jgi:CheY-like chemotaxis protein
MMGYNILVVDDDEDDFFIIKQAFIEVDEKPLLYHVKDGKQLLDYLYRVAEAHEKFPDLIIMDINMPKIDGIRALELIKATKLFLHIPVIMHSTSNDALQKKKCTTLGAEGFIQKGSTHQSNLLFVKSINKILAKFTEAGG